MKKRKLCTSLTLDSDRLQACACDILFSDVLVYCLFSCSILIFVRNAQMAKNKNNNNEEWTKQQDIYNFNQFNVKFTIEVPAIFPSVTLIKT